MATYLFFVFSIPRPEAPRGRQKGPRREHKCTRRGKVSMFFRRHLSVCSDPPARLHFKNKEKQQFDYTFQYTHDTLRGGATRQCKEGDRRFGGKKEKKKGKGNERMLGGKGGLGRKARWSTRSSWWVLELMEWRCAPRFPRFPKRYLLVEHGRSYFAIVRRRLNGLSNTQILRTVGLKGRPNRKSFE